LVTFFDKNRTENDHPYIKHHRSRDKPIYGLKTQKTALKTEINPSTDLSFMNFKGKKTFDINSPH